MGLGGREGEEGRGGQVVRECDGFDVFLYAGETLAVAEGIGACEVGSDGCEESSDLFVFGEDVFLYGGCNGGG